MKEVSPVEIIERDLTKLATRFDRHLEIYAQNGKELFSLKTVVNNTNLTLEKKIDRSTEDIKILTERITSMEIDVSKLAIKVGIYASIGSAAATTLVGLVVKSLPF